MGLVRSPRDGNKPQYVMPGDGVYLVVVRVYAKVNSQPFTASVHVSMLSDGTAVSLIFGDCFALLASSSLLSDLCHSLDLFSLESFSPHK